MTSTLAVLSPRTTAGRACLLFVFMLLVFIPSALRREPEADIYMASLEGWRIATAHTPWFDGVDMSSVNKFFMFEFGRGPHGHVLIWRSPGVVAAAIPAYVLRGGPPTMAAFSLAPAAITAAILTAVTVAILYLTLRRNTSDRVAILSCIVFAFATPIWTINATGLWTHTLTVFGIVAMAWAADRSKWLLVGVFGGVAIWGRLHTLVIVAVLGLGLAIVRRRPSIAVKIAISSGLLTIGASLWSYWLYQNWLPSGGYNGANILQGAVSTDSGVWHLLRSVGLNELGLWISPSRGILTWTPILALLLPALWRSRRELPAWSLLLMAGGLAYTLVQGLSGAGHNTQYFTGGFYFYGYRLTLELLACSTPALVMSVPKMGRLARRLLWPITGVLISIMFIGVAQGGGALHPGDGWTDNTLWIALRDQPARWVLLVLGLTIGLMANRKLNGPNRALPLNSESVQPS